MKYEYEAVSGDQSLFDLTDDESCVVIVFNKPRMNLIFFNYKEDFGGNNTIIAERKVKEVKLPVVGDVVKNNNYHMEYKVVYISIADVVIESTEGLCFSVSHDYMKEKYTIIEQSKQPNPVNMVEEKWVPKVGDKFRVR